MLQGTDASALELYLANRAAFNRQRRKARLDFDSLHALFASNLSFAEIARRAGVSRPRIDIIFERYFRALFGVTGLERQRRRETEAREVVLRRVARVVARDRVIDAICQSARRGRVERRIEPILLGRSRDPVRRFRHRAVRVDGTDVEPVHHVRNRKLCPSGGTTYAVTSVSRAELERSIWIIFYVDVPRYRRRVIRSRSMRLLKALFPPGAGRKNVYIPLDRSPESPRYDFLADEDNWG